jgi:dipeptidyl aminopeptidase/acylaminoacyl peptidase
MLSRTFLLSPPSPPSARLAARLLQAARRRACLACLALAAGLPLTQCLAPAFAGVGPTVKEVVEFTRIIQPVLYDDETLRTQVSPDGQLLFIVTRKANVATDRNRFEILLMDVSPASLSALAARRTASGPGASMSAAPTAPPSLLLAVESSTDRADSDPSLREVRWVGNRTLVFRARMNDEAHQVYAVDVITRKVRQLTYAPNGVLTFEVPDDLRRVVYVSQVPNPALEPGARAIIVGSKSYWSVHGRQDDLYPQDRLYQFFVAEAGLRMPARPLGEPFPRAGRPPVASFSPDGRWVLLPKDQPERQLEWAGVYPQVAELSRQYGASAAVDPLGYFSRPTNYAPRQMMVYRASDGQARVVLDAPDDSAPGSRQRHDRLWQGGGTSVVIAGTYLPMGQEGAAAAAGKDGDRPDRTTSHIIEYWPASGEWKHIAALKGRLQGVQAGAGEEGRFTAIDGEQRRIFDRLPDGRWQEVADDPMEGVPARQTGEGQPAPGAAALGQGDGGGKRDGSAVAQQTWRLHVRQALNQPADVVALRASGGEVRLTQLNPQFVAAQWGTMKEYSWTDGKGRRWDGGLMVPADFQPGVRYPLVIQSYGFDPKRFYRDGTNDYDGATSGFAGRAFLREGILVLALPWRAAIGAPRDEHGSIVAFGEGVRGAIDALVAQGLVDRDRIGILGWSATGVRVQHLITFTDTPIRAATILDGDVNTLYSLTITYGFADSTLKSKEDGNQGPPFGATRERWIRNDPSLHTDCIRAALRIESYGAEAKNNSDIYALLRRQYRPVEMLKFPEGGHALSRPSERMISLQGNVDWYRFWLKGERRMEPLVLGETAESLQQQRARWDQMLTMKAQADRLPRCVRKSL